MKKQDIKDDDRTIADMNVEGMPWYTGRKSKDSNKQLERIELTKKEQRAMFIGLMQAMLPIIVTIVIFFTLAYLFLDLVWLK